MNETPELNGAGPHDHERIATAAYARYELRGRQDGYALDDWLEAEREIRGTAS